MKKPVRQRGSAILEMLFAEILLFGFIAFVMLMGRVLSERNRMLAANRTLSWMYTHTADTEACRDLFASEGFAQLVRRWHFKERGRGVGVVNIGEGQIGSGLFPGGGTVDAFQDAASGMIEEKTEEKPSSEEGKTDKEKEFQDSGNNLSDSKYLVAAMVNFFTDDFKWYRADVSFGIPVASSGFLREMAKRGSLGELSNNGRDAYAFIRPATAEGCVLPMLDAGAKQGGIPGISDMLENLISDGQETIEKNVPNNIYRPYDKDGNLDEDALHWLLVYEIDDTPGNPQREARGDN